MRAEDLLQPLRILQARHLDQDAVGALALDVRLGRAARVDAAADDLDRLVDGAAHALVDAGFRVGERDQAVGRDSATSMARLPRLAEDGVADRLRQFAQLRHEPVAVGRVGNADLHAARRAAGCRPAASTRVSRRMRRTSSRSWCRLGAHEVLASTSSRTCEPPCRSRPSTMARDGTIQDGTQPGSARWNALRCSRVIMLGTASSRPMTMIAQRGDDLRFREAQHRPLNLFCGYRPKPASPRPALLLRP